MTRNKVKLQFIVNDSTRKATFKKRKKGLLKKLKELTTLCAVEACAIIYSLYDAQPEVWSSPSGVRRVLTRFLNLSEEDQGKRRLDQVAYLRQRIAKVRQQLEKLRAENKERKIREIMYDCLSGASDLEGLNFPSSKDLCSEIDRTMQRVAKKIESIQKHNVENY